MEEIEKRLETISERIRAAALSCGRDPETVRLVAVSKTVDAVVVKKAIDSGVRILGENYVREARDKIDEIGSEKVSWHFIGHLQTNKAKYAVKMFDLIHSVDSLKLASELDRQARRLDKIQDILIQINIGEEETKSGIARDDLERLLSGMADLAHLSVKGLMVIPPFFDAPEKVRPFFMALRELRDRVTEGRNLPDNVTLDELSMGMTGDFEAAIQEGATLVRIGTAIFGRRQA